MLVIKRKSGERFRIIHAGEELAVRVETVGQHVRVILQGPKTFKVTRQELLGTEGT
jgi:sRNA-binding carbon storage regulator CsrA